jgi:hypothetical protein
MSFELTNNLTTAARLKDELDGMGQPSRISDRKLLELVERLDRLRQLGGPFAEVELSPSLRVRLDLLRSNRSI